MSGINVHFAFPDNVLAYDCTRCDQRCCKTGMLALFPSERPRISRRYPALDLAVPTLAGPITFLTTPYAGCWFLRQGGCTLVALEDGRERPCGCSLFPFNIFAMLGDVLVVAPNALCPFEIVPDRGIRHGQVAAELGRLGLAGAPPAALRCQDPPRSIVLERVVREAATAAVASDSPLALLAFMEAATRAFVSGGLAGLSALDLDSAEALVPEVTRRLSRLAGLAGVPPPSPRALAAVTPVLAAWAPSLRLFAFDALPIARLPQALLALALYLCHWHDLRPERPLLPQTVAQMVSAMGPVLHLLAATDEQALAQLCAQLPHEPLSRALALRNLAQRSAGGEP